VDVSSYCDWPVLTCGETKLDSLTAEVRAEVEAMAVTMLFNWTGQRFGSCPVTVRPCRKRCYDRGWSPAWPIITRGNRPLLDDASIPLTDDGDNPLTDDSVGSVYGSHCGRCRGECGCGYVPQVLLPAPVQEVLSVWVDGEELSLEHVRVDDHALLVRTDGYDWPLCQDLTLPDDAVGAWSITYVRGEAVPPGGGLVAGSLASELAKAFCQDASCRLPKRLTSVTRQGLTAVVFDDFRDLKAGRTGIWEVDYWVNNVCTDRSESTLRSPDVQTVRRTTWTGFPSS
jgi:hypothetical protein